MTDAAYIFSFIEPSQASRTAFLASDSRLPRSGTADMPWKEKQT
jgi:hypothetical protein